MDIAIISRDTFKLGFHYPQMDYRFPKVSMVLPPEVDPDLDAPLFTFFREGEEWAPPGFYVPVERPKLAFSPPVRVDCIRWPYLPDAKSYVQDLMSGAHGSQVVGRRCELLKAGGGVAYTLVCLFCQQDEAPDLSYYHVPDVGCTPIRIETSDHNPDLSSAANRVLPTDPLTEPVQNIMAALLEALAKRG